MQHCCINYFLFTYCIFYYFAQNDINAKNFKIRYNWCFSQWVLYYTLCRHTYFIFGKFKYISLLRNNTFMVAIIKLFVFDCIIFCSDFSSKKINKSMAWNCIDYKLVFFISSYIDWNIWDSQHPRGLELYSCFLSYWFAFI